MSLFSVTSEQNDSASPQLMKKQALLFGIRKVFLRRNPVCVHEVMHFTFSLFEINRKRTTNEWQVLLDRCGIHSHLPLLSFFASLGVWSRPRHLIINTSAVELYWDQPPQPNGHISQYRLNRDGHTIFTGDHRDQNYTDTGLLPNRR